MSAASRISFWLKGDGWSSHPEATVQIFLERSNYPAPSGQLGNLTLPDMTPYLLDGAWHKVTIALPLNPSAYCEWDGYASQIRVRVEYDHSGLGNITSILIDGWVVDSFDTGKVLGLADQGSFVEVHNGILEVGGSACFESVFTRTDGWYYQYSGNGIIMMCINGTWTSPPDEGMPCHWNLTGVRLFNGSFDWFKVNALPPLVEILSPADESLVRGTIPVQVNATDVSGIKRVEFSVDGVLQYTDIVQPFFWLWNTKGHPDGVHILNVTAYANSGAVNFYHVEVNVDNTGPSVSIDVPLNKAVVGGCVELRASANDSSGVAQVEFYVNGTLLKADTSAPYSFSWNTLTESDGLKNVTCIALDAAGNKNKVTFLITVDNSGPLITIHTLSVWTNHGLVAVNTSDPSGIDRVEFFLDGLLKYTDYAYPYEWLWSGSSIPDGHHNFSVRSFDILNHSSSAFSEFDIDNTLPSLSICWAPSGTVVRGVVSFNATASDANGIACVDFCLDGGLKHSAFLFPYLWSWDTTLVRDGQHTLSVIAVDGKGNAKWVVMDLLVDNTGPVITVNSPSNQTAFYGPSSINAVVTVSDLSGIDCVLLSYCTGLSWTTVVMIPSGSQFQATTPTFQPDTTVLLRFFANDTLGIPAWSSTYTCVIAETTSPTSQTVPASQPTISLPELVLIGAVSVAVIGIPLGLAIGHFGTRVLRRRISEESQE